MTDNSLVLSWQIPENDGGSKIIEYVVEYKKTSEKTWNYVGTTNGDETHILVQKLKRKTKYNFKICARNEAGLSLPLIPDEEITVGAQISTYNCREMLLLFFNILHYMNVYPITNFFVICFYEFSTTVPTTKSHTNYSH